jgi:predicted XRE-type DNA-binding protein
MNAISPDLATIAALRSDLALQIARSVARTRESQVAAAARLGIPQPTLSKIVNGRVSELSLELLIRIAVRAELPIVLQTGRDPSEAGVFVARSLSIGRAQQSKVAEGAQDALAESVRRLTPEQRLEAHLKHSELVMALHAAGREAPSGTRSKTTKSAR